MERKAFRLIFPRKGRDTLIGNLKDDFTAVFDLFLMLLPLDHRDGRHGQHRQNSQKDI